MWTAGLLYLLLTYIYLWEIRNLSNFSSKPVLALCTEAHRFLVTYIYIHNWPLQPFSQDYWPSFSHHFHFILYISGGAYSLKSIPNERFEKFFMAILFTLRVFARNLLRGNRRRNTFRISFWCLAWDFNAGFWYNKPTHYLLDHANFWFLVTQQSNTFAQGLLLFPWSVYWLGCRSVKPNY